ncbi:MAG TPA: hypothetical protein VMV10_26215 [Pirellulales bacterium]|nr:hypothetical protein [Pirellulales bacterium]
MTNGKATIRRAGRPRCATYLFASAVSAAKVVKWNCVFRVRDSGGIAPGGYLLRIFVLVGDLNTVQASLRALHREFAAGK